MRLININDFNGELYIANKADSSIQQKLNVLIDKYQPKFMRELFGKTMGDLFNLALNDMSVRYSYPAGAANPIVISNIDGRTKVLINQIMPDGSKRRRTDVGISYQIVGNLPESVTLNFGGVVPAIEVELVKPVSHEISVTFPAAVGNTVLIDDYQELYSAQYGNNPFLTVYEIDGSNKIVRTDVQPVLNYAGGLLQSISMDFGVIPNGELVMYANSVIDDRWLTLSNDTELKYMLTCYVYYWLTRDGVSFNSATGVVKADNQNSTPRDARDKMVKAWNDMWEQVLMYQVDMTIYPEFERFTRWGCAWREIYSPINSLNI